MDEYERLEEELQYLYNEYVSKYRNLNYLERDLEEFSKKEQEQEIEVNKQLEQERLNI